MVRQIMQERFYRRMKVVKGRYPLLKSASEFDRLDKQHREVYRAMGQHHHLAPVHDPQAILDIGCGTGLWCLDETLHFKQASLVVGIDLTEEGFNRLLRLRQKRHQRIPRGLRFQQADALKPLPFEDGTFDFVHGRFMSSFIPLPSWPSVVAEMVRVTRSRGWVEVTEVSGLHDTGAPTVHQFVVALQQLFKKRNIDVIGASLTKLLVSEGLTSVQGKDLLLTGPATVEMLALAPQAFAAAMLHDEIFSQKQLDEILAKFGPEAAASGLTMPVVTAYGQKK